MAVDTLPIVAELRTAAQQRYFGAENLPVISMPVALYREQYSQLMAEADLLTRAADFIAQRDEKAEAFEKFNAMFRAREFLSVSTEKPPPHSTTQFRVVCIQDEGADETLAWGDDLLKAIQSLPERI